MLLFDLGLSCYAAWNSICVGNHVITVLGLIHFGVIQILDPVVGVVG